MSIHSNSQTSYGFSEPNVPVFNPPIIATRNPGVNDRAPLGTMWVNKNNNNVWFLTSVTAGQSEWSGGTGGAGAFATVTAITTITAGTTVTAGTNVIATNAVTAGTNITATAGNIVATLGNIAATAGHITAGTTITAGTDIVSTRDVVSGRDVTAVRNGVIGGTLTVTGLSSLNGALDVTGDIAGSANIIAGADFVFANGVAVISGNGDPNGAVAAAEGSLFLRHDPAGAASRLYINTDGAMTWTHFTAAA